MANNLKYTTEKLKAQVLADKEVSEEAKEQEQKKPIISEDAFALCDLIYDLKNQIRLSRGIN